jgi:hypothetical protein
MPAAASPGDPFPDPWLEGRVWYGTVRYTFDLSSSSDSGSSGVSESIVVTFRGDDAPVATARYDATSSEVRTIDDDERCTLVHVTELTGIHSIRAEVFAPFESPVGEYRVGADAQGGVLTTVSGCEQEGEFTGEEILGDISLWDPTHLVEYTGAGDCAGVAVDEACVTDDPDHLAGSKVAAYDNSDIGTTRWTITMEWNLSAFADDADQDGVPDDLDQCPGTPIGTVVDVNGCPLPADCDAKYTHAEILAELDTLLGNPDVAAFFPDVRWCTDGEEVTVSATNLVTTDSLNSALAIAFGLVGWELHWVNYPIDVTDGGPGVMTVDYAGDLGATFDIVQALSWVGFGGVSVVKHIAKAAAKPWLAAVRRGLGGTSLKEYVLIELRRGINGAAAQVTKKLPAAIRDRLTGLPGKFERAVGKDVADLAFLAVQAAIARAINAEIDALIVQVQQLIDQHTGKEKHLVAKIDEKITEVLGGAATDILGADDFLYPLWEPRYTLRLQADGGVDPALDSDYQSPFFSVHVVELVTED